MKVPNGLIGIVIWAALGLPGTGMMLSYLDHKFPGDCREQAGFAYGWGMLFGPIASGAAVFLTGFAEDGFQYTCREKLP